MRFDLEEWSGFASRIALGKNAYEISSIAHVIRKYFIEDNKWKKEYLTHTCSILNI